jgi:hypothetical protein
MTSITVSPRSLEFSGATRADDATHFSSPGDPLRGLALTVDESEPGSFRWKILEVAPSRYTAGRHQHHCDVLCCGEMTFSAYDAALAAGYGELQRQIGPDLQFGPRLVPARAGTVSGLKSRPVAAATNRDAIHAEKQKNGLA